MKETERSTNKRVHEVGRSCEITGATETKTQDRKFAGAEERLNKPQKCDINKNK